ncbi:unnamed protein product [Effrenium voratum]|nr:unnamed protein product [Effrenium voratum]
MGHPWVYDNEVRNISELTGINAGTLVDIFAADGRPMGVGVLNRQACIVLRRVEGLQTGAEVTQELLSTRLRAAFAAREKRPDAEFCRAFGEQDGLPGILVDRFGRGAVVTFQALGSTKLELLLQEELTRWIGKLQQLTVHRMSAKKEKWAQEGSEFTTQILRGDHKVRVEEASARFDVDVLQGLVPGHWNYSLEKLRARLAESMASGTVLDAWAHCGQWGIRCGLKGAEVVLLEDSLGLAKLCRENAQLNGLGADGLWGSWKWMDYAHVVIIVVDSWMGGLVVMKLSTTVKTMIRNSALLSVLLLLDRVFWKDQKAPEVALGEGATAEVYEDERKLRVIDVSELPRMKSKVFSDFEAEDEEDDSPWWQCNSPWLGCYDRKWKGEPDAPEEQPPEKAGSGMDSQMMIISLVYAATDTTRTLLNSYALSSSQINPNSMSFLTFLVGLVFASLMTWRAHGLGCAKADEELGESESGKGLKQAWSIRKIIEYGNSSMLQAVTMCLGNMAYAFGLSPSMAAVLGKVYTPVLAVGERLILKKRRQPVEWFAVIILTLGTFAFLWLQIYDFEEGLGKAMSNMLPLILCILGAVTAAIQALVSQGIYEANRDVDFYMNKVRFDAGSAIFTLLVVPLLSLTASRGKDLVWLPRAVEADCDVNACWPKVTSFSNGGSIHWPWSMEDSMMTCTAPECTGRGGGIGQQQSSCPVF